MIGDWMRLVLTLLLIFGVYTETGWMTALFAFLIAARCEVKDYNDGVTFKDSRHD